MNRLDFTLPGGLWGHQGTLDFLQQTYAPLLTAITTALGDNVIISGCVKASSNVSPGWIILNGELLPYEGGVYAPQFKMEEIVTKEQFDDGSQKDVYYVHKAVMTISGGVPFESFSQIKSLAAFKSLPTAAGSDYSAAKDDVLATITGLFNLKNELLTLIKGFNGIIVQWSGSISQIPAGWQLCDGSNDSPDLRDRFILGAGSSYGIGDTGGEKTHTLSADEMPSHSHSTTFGKNGNGGGGSDWAYMDTSTGHSNASVSSNSVGGGAAHNNMPPYYALAFIYRIPID